MRLSGGASVGFELQSYMARHGGAMVGLTFETYSRYYILICTIWLIRLRGWAMVGLRGYAMVGLRGWATVGLRG